MVSSFFQLLYSHSVGQEGDDRICWSLPKRESLKLGPTIMCYPLLLIPLFLGKSIWRVKAPSKDGGIRENLDFG